MDIEAGLINKVLETKNLKEIVNARIDESFFYSQWQEAFKFLVDYWRKYGEVPTEKVFRSKYPVFAFEKYTEPIEYFIEELRKQKKYNIIVESMKKAAKEIEDDEDKAFKSLQKGLSEIQVKVYATRDLDLILDVERRKENYKEGKIAGAIKGIRTGWKSLDESLLGIKPEDLVVIVGRQAVGKTMMAVILSHKAWEQGYLPIFVTKEMAPELIARRWDAVHSRLDYKKFRLAELGAKDEERYFKDLEELKKKRGCIITGGGLEGGSVLSVEAKIEEYKPDVVIVDGIYLLEDIRKGGTREERLTNVIRDLKNLAQRKRIPIIATTQLGRRAEEKTSPILSDIAYSDSVGQTADCVISIFQTVMDEEDKVMNVKVLKHREGEKLKFKIKWDFEGMNFKEIIGSKEEEVKDGGETIFY